MYTSVPEKAHGVWGIPPLLERESRLRLTHYISGFSFLTVVLTMFYVLFHFFPRNINNKSNVFT